MPDDLSQRGVIQLRGVAVHNLRQIDLDLPLGRLIVICGVSGSGKSSLALDTLYAEGQRRYIETFSPQARQFLEQLEKPAAERIDGIPPAVAVTRANPRQFHRRTTIGSATEIEDFLTLLWAKLGTVSCPRCGRNVRRDSPGSVAATVESWPAGTRLVVTYPLPVAEGEATAAIASLRESGFVRVIAGGQTVALDGATADAIDTTAPWLVVVDRLAVGGNVQRLTDSLETAFARGGGRCTLLREADESAAAIDSPRMTVDERPWEVVPCSERFECQHCEQELAPPEPRHFRPDSPLGACPQCEGAGTILDFDWDLVIPDASKSLRDGAIVAWTGKPHAEELQHLLATAGDLGLDVDVPVSQLDERQRAILWNGDPQRGFVGLTGFFAAQQPRKHQLSQRAFLNRFRASRVCPACQGARLRPESLAVRIAEKNVAELCRLKTVDAAAFLRHLPQPLAEHAVARTLLDQVLARLAFLESVGLGYLTLDRPLHTLSGGEAQRVALTTALGSSLVQMLYVLDEPTIGLHPHDVAQVARAVRRLCERGNTVVVVEHEESMLRGADELIEIGPGAGERGGRIVFQGRPEDIVHAPGSVTGDYLAGRRGSAPPSSRRPKQRGAIRLVGARGHHLKNLTVEFPLGMLCLVTGVSGSGKSTLVEETLYPALCQRKRIDCERPAPFDDVFGDGQIDDIVLVDQSPISRSPRSNPVTFVKAFDEIRQVFADTVEARTRNFTAGHFSFNVEGGRCPACAGDGVREIDMQFLADVFVKCPECRGRRYRPEILKVRHRGLDIAEVLDMTVREAFGFFRGQVKVQQRLKQLLDAGLDYIRLGQAANTLSGGESQRLKLAAQLATTKRRRTLFLLDEPTTGLHFADVAQLLDCFTALLDVGHSLIVIDHNPQLLQAADWILDLGPGAAEEGGHLIAAGPPEQIAQNPRSLTGQHLARWLAAAAE